jgi:uroporphyrinogen-III synthase
MTVQIGATRRVIVTRSKEGNREFGESLREAGFEVVPVDTLSFLPPSNWSEVDGRLRRLHEFDWLTVTSGVGARFFLRRMNKLLLERRWSGKPSVAAVGPGTRDILEDGGIRVQFTPSAYLTKKLALELPLKRGKKVLLLRSDIAQGGMLKTLQRRGFSVEEQVIYRTRFVTGEIEADLASADAIIFASPSAIEGFCSRITQPTLDSLTETPVLCIGPVTARAAKIRGFKRIITPSVYTFESLVRELGKL